MAVKPLILLALVMVVLGTPQGANAASAGRNIWF
jgi:hypothetical protein